MEDYQDPENNGEEVFHEFDAAFHERKYSNCGAACQYFLYSQVKRPGGRAAVAAGAPRCEPSRVASHEICSQIPKGGEQIPLAAKRDPYTPEQPTTRSLFRYPQSGGTPQRPGKVAGSLNVQEPVIPPSLGRYARPKENFTNAGVHKIFFQRAVRSPAHSPLGHSLLVPGPRTLWGSRSVSPSHLREAKKVDFFGLPKKLTRVSFAVSRVRFFLLRPKKLRAIET